MVQGVREPSNGVVSAVMAAVLVLSGSCIGGRAYADKPQTSAIEAEEATLEDLEAACVGPNDPNFLCLVENAVWGDLSSAIDSEQYFVTDVQTVYVSPEYLEELAYNSQANVYFGYTLDELDEMFGDTRYVFDLGEDGQTVVREFAPYSDEFGAAALGILKDVGIGTGAVLCWVTLGAVTPVAGLPTAVTALCVFGAHSVVSVAAMSAAVEGVFSGVITAVETRSVSAAVGAVPKGMASGFKWGAIAGPAVDYTVGRIAGSKVVEVAGTELGAPALLEGVQKGGYHLIELDCRNAVLAGSKCARTDVEYVRRYILQSDGMTLIRGVFPRFASKFETRLPKELWQSPNYARECTKRLASELEHNPTLKAQFSERQLEQIVAGKTPEGYVWHHNEEEGLMQLVDEWSHMATPHAGGSSIWGGRATVETGQVGAANGLHVASGAAVGLVDAVVNEGEDADAA